MNTSVSRLCLFVAFMIVSGCSKSCKDDVVDISAPELSVINESLRDYMFSKQDFNEPNSVWAFLQELAALHYDSYLLVGSSGTMRLMERNDISSWLRGKEKSKAVLRELCSDPKFMLEGNKWKVLFNMFKKDGSVDKWEVVGKHDPENKYNQVEKIEISTLRPKGTFSWPLMG
jgi:hypothetical protein